MDLQDAKPCPDCESELLGIFGKPVSGQVGTWVGCFECKADGPAATHINIETELSKAVQNWNGWEGK